MTPTSTIDLHMHTHYSDGKYSPAELLRYAASIGLETIAITDHDNANGVREAWPLAQELGIERPRNSSL
jgi:predicted metal-dependent phosphoesterase TrpH